MAKKRSSSKKEMSEGKTITVAVLLITGGLIAFIFLFQYIINFFFPNF